ncbi:hypothetical protein GF354_02410 [Candidatus Peregrinibacteria bacterium]|nr:hypothetical protein [Candidatus Peregrinibacteria bacterium]
MKNKKILAIWMAFLLSVFYPASPALAADGDNAVFTFEPLNGKAGENEVKLVVNTDNAAINHLIFDIVDTGGGNPLVFDMTGTNDPVEFPLHNNSVLGSESAFTTISGDIGYDLSSSNPANTASYSALHFATLIADQNLPSGAGGILTYDTDTAIYVDLQRKGTFAGSYTVLPNAAPVISNPAVDGTSLAGSTVAPSAGDTIPTQLVTDVSPPGLFTFDVADSTDASVQRQMKVYKRLDDGSWGYPASPTYTRTLSRSGTDMSFSWSQGLEYGTYYKVEYVATDDQGASDTETYYFSTATDTSPPTQVSQAYMTFISESNTRTDVIGQISFSTTTDNNAVDNYYLWSKDHLVARNIIDSSGNRDLTLDTSGDSTVSDEEFYVGLRALVTSGDYITSISAASAGSTPYFSITGNQVDRYDSTASEYYVPNSLAEDILYVVAADDATKIDGSSGPNFSDFKTVYKAGDTFGAEVTLDHNSTTYNYTVGDGSLNVWDSVYLYRNIIGLFSEYPVLMPDMVHSNPYSYPDNTSTSSTTTN